jgi:hypothetical protein
MRERDFRFAHGRSISARIRRVKSLVDLLHLAWRWRSRA